MRIRWKDEALSRGRAPARAEGARRTQPRGKTAPDPYVGLLAVNVLFLALMVLTVAGAPAVLRAPVGLACALFGTGYGLLVVLVPERRRLSLEMVSLSIGLSIAGVGLAGLVLYKSGWRGPVFVPVLALWAPVLAATALVSLRQRGADAPKTVRARWTLALREWRTALRHNRVSPKAAARYLALAAAIVLGMLLALYPHRSYPFPIHVDEWMHLGLFRAWQATGPESLTAGYAFPDLHSGGIRAQLADAEPAFHAFWALFQAVTGLPWLAVFRYFPAVVFGVTLLSVHTWARPRGFGVEATALAVLIPTNVTILGPGLLVPVALALALLPLGLRVAWDYRSGRSLVAFTLIVLFLALAHPPSALVLALVSVPFAIANASRRRRRVLLVGGAFAAAAAVASPLALELIPELIAGAKAAIELPDFLPYLTRPYLIWGIGYTVVFVIGLASALWGWQRWLFPVIAACIFLLLHSYVFEHWGRGVQILYHRGPLYLTLLASFVGGYGLRSIMRLRAPSQGQGVGAASLLAGKYLGPVVFAVLLAWTLADGVRLRLETPFYQMIDREDYTAFEWIAENVPACFDRALLDPWKATAFVAVTGRDVYSRIHHAPGEKDRKAYEMLEGGAGNTDFLRSEGASIIYSRAAVTNTEAQPVHENVYLLRSASRCDG